MTPNEEQSSPTAAPSAAWTSTYNAALTGLSAGVATWAQGRADVEVNDMMRRIERAARRSADRMHGVQVEPEPRDMMP